MDYRKSAQEVLDNIGGAGNVVSAAHCATRLRLVIADIPALYADMAIVSLKGRSYSLMAQFAVDFIVRQAQSISQPA